MQNQTESLESILEYLYGALYDTGELRLDRVVSVAQSGCTIVPPAFLPSLSLS